MKDPHFYAGFNAPETAFTEGDPKLHKERRKLIQNNFSKQTIQNGAQMVQGRIDALDVTIKRLGPKEPVNMHNALRYVCAR